MAAAPRPTLTTARQQQLAEIETVWRALDRMAPPPEKPRAGLRKLKRDRPGAVVTDHRAWPGIRTLRPSKAPRPIPRDAEGERCRAVVDAFFRHRWLVWPGAYYSSKQSRQEHAQLLAETLWGPLTATWRKGRDTGTFPYARAQQPAAHVRRCLHNLIHDHRHVGNFGSGPGTWSHNCVVCAASMLPRSEPAMAPDDYIRANKWGDDDDSGGHFGGGHPSDTVLEQLHWKANQSVSCVCPVSPADKLREMILPKLKTTIERQVLELRLSGIPQRAMVVPDADTCDIAAAVRKIQRISRDLRPQRPATPAALPPKAPRPASPMILLAIFKRWLRWYRPRTKRRDRWLRPGRPARQLTKYFDRATDRWVDAPHGPVLMRKYTAKVYPPGPGCAEHFKF